MVGSKPNPYLSEQARLEAQRRMLAERYGLFSDDSDDAEETRHDNTSSSSQPANGGSNHTKTSPTAIQPPAAANGRQPLTNPDVLPGARDSVSVASASASASASAAAAAAAAAASQSAPVDAASTRPRARAVDATRDATASVTSSTAVASVASAAAAAAAAARADAAWPPVDLVDPAHANHIRARFDYTSSSRPHQSPPRDVRVTQITHYSSQLLESHQRKIAVNNEVVSYGVGGHVRAMLRHAPARCLLKGHNSVVADIEFLSFLESRVDSRASNHISILGSVADDGSVYVWKLVRNGTGEEQTLDVADAIRFEHPDFDKGRSYKRIAFRPGPNSIIAENGIGVAMLLLDINSTDLRIVELVKMNDKMMVRDKFLRARHEMADGETVDGNLEAAAWLSETIVATSRGGHVFLWNADNNYSGCFARVPRERSSQVTAIHTLNQDTLLFVVSHGREIEVWVAKDIAPDMSSTSLQLQQTIRLFSDADKDVHCVASMDPSEQLMTVSNVRGNSFFVLHFNQAAGAFDAMTEVPMKHSIYSFCVTPLSRPPLPASLPSVPHAEAHDEIGVWCVQPPGIQVVHLPALVCRPSAKVVPEIYPKPVAMTVRRKVEKIPPALIAQTQGQGSGSTLGTLGMGLGDAGAGTAKRVPRSIAGIKTGGGTDAMSVAPQAVSAGGKGPGGTGGPPVAGASGGGGSAHGKGIGEGRARGGLGGDVDGKSGVAVVGDGGGKKPISLSSISTSVSMEASVVNGDEMADAVLNAAKKAIAAFEEAAAQRNLNEKAKMDKLIETVSETAESNFERFINSSMKKVLADTLIPGVSVIIAEARETLREKSKVPVDVAREHFEEVFERAEINKSFANVCKEMGRQVSGVVTQSMGAKYDSLIQPTIEMVNDATEDLNTSVSLLREEVRKMKVDEDEDEQRVVEIEAEDVRRAIEEQINEGNIDEAFLTALDKVDLSLVTWLCGKFDAAAFFLENNLSQVSLMSLAQQLGQGLAEGGDVMLKVDWLREVMVALEPEAEDIEPISSQAVHELVVNVNELRKNTALLEQHAGLERKLKTVGRLISSHLRT